MSSFQFKDPEFDNREGKEKAVYQALSESHPSLRQFKLVWDYACDFAHNRDIMKIYNGVFTKRAFVTRPRKKKHRNRRSFFDKRAIYLHMSTLDELKADGYHGYLAVDGKIRFKK